MSQWESEDVQLSAFNYKNQGVRWFKICTHITYFINQNVDNAIMNILRTFCLAVPNYGNRKSKKVEGKIDWVTHNQTLIQLRQLNDRNQHIAINTNT
jgi:hypothetical protein